MTDEFNNYLTGEAEWQDNTSIFVPSAVHQATSPTYEAFGVNGLYALKFLEGEIAFINFHIQHDILIGSKLYPHVHFSPIGVMANGETIVWDLEYISANRSEGQSLTDPLTPMSITYTADGSEVAGEHLVVECSDGQAFVTGDVDSLVLFKVTRGDGTYAGDVFGHTMDLHYQIGRIGTPNKSAPFV